MAFSSGDSKKSAMSEINVAPLVDVMLVLLIIFMVTTAAAEQERIDKQKKDSIQEQTESLVELNLPVTPENSLVADPETSKLVMVIDKNLRVFLVRGITGAAGEKSIADCSSYLSTKDPAPWEECFNKVEEKLVGNHRLLKEGLYLEGDADVPYGYVSGIMERLRGIGVESVDIVTNPNFAMDVGITPASD